MSAFPWTHTHTHTHSHQQNHPWAAATLWSNLWGHSGGIPVVPVVAAVLSGVYSVLPFQHCSFTTPLFIHNQCGQYGGILGQLVYCKWKFMVKRTIKTRLYKCGWAAAGDYFLPVYGCWWELFALFVVFSFYLLQLSSSLTRRGVSERDGQNRALQWRDYICRPARGPSDSEFCNLVSTILFWAGEMWRGHKMAACVRACVHVFSERPTDKLTLILLGLITFPCLWLLSKPTDEEGNGDNGEPDEAVSLR